MAKQVLVVGLGRFGRALARGLTRQGCEVLAVDAHAPSVHVVASDVAQAMTLDAADEAALATLAPAERDLCVCAIGDTNREGSIIVTALLKQMGAKHLVARATDDIHARVLRAVGADEIVAPEQSFGERLALKLAWRRVVNVFALAGDLVLTEWSAPPTTWGRTLVELNLQRRYAVTVAAVLRDRAEGLAARVPDPHQPIAEGELLMLVGREADVRRLIEAL